MRNNLTFNREGYDPFIDFIKAFAIVCVLVGHFFPYCNIILGPLWIDFQVPLFVLVQVFHFYKKDKPRPLSILFIIRRIIIPLILIQVVIMIYLYLCRNIRLDDIMHSFRTNGCYGQGDYYPLIYIQIALIMPLFYKILKKISYAQSVFLFMIISVSLDYICSRLHVSDSIYRVLAIRYLFLIPLGYKWQRKGVSFTLSEVTLSFVSLISIIYFSYFSSGVDLSPLFYNTGWVTHRWPCYFFVSGVGVLILYNVWDRLNSVFCIRQIISTIAKCSYEIFLAQMFAYVLFDGLIVSKINTYSNIPIGACIRFIFCFVFSITFGIIFNKLLKYLMK